MLARHWQNDCKSVWRVGGGEGGGCFLALVSIFFQDVLTLGFGNTSVGELAFRQVYYWLSVADIW